MMRQMTMALAIFGLPIAYMIGSEVYYAQSISPLEVTTVRDFFRRFGDPSRIRRVQKDGKRYYEFTGRLPSGMVLAIPSSPPVYFFDDEGRFVTWDRDPCEHPQAAPIQDGGPMDVPAIREKFDL
jgi:hypothetical protein